MKKRILREELKRQRRTSRRRRVLLATALAVTVLFGIGTWFYINNLEKILSEEYLRMEQIQAQGQYEEAAQGFRKIYERRPGFAKAPQALFQTGEILNLYLRRYPEALIAYLEVIKSYPGTELARQSYGQVAEIYNHRLRDYGQAIVFYQRLLDSGAQEPDRLQYEIADSYFRLENYEQARIEFDILGKNYPDSPLVPEVAYRIAVSYSLEGKLQEAIEGYRDLLEKWPDTGYALEARLGLAAALEEGEELREALKILQELDGVYPNAEVLATRIEKVKERISKKKKAI